jgi:Glycosyltransferase family 87
MRPAVAASLAALGIVAIEAATRSQARYAPECVLFGAAAWYAWRRRVELTTAFVVALAVVLPAVVASVHIARHVTGDIDVQSVYPAEGHQLLSGSYPHSEYPPGAVVLFAVEEWIRNPRSVNPYVMAICAGAIAWAICSLGTSVARWVALIVALLPVNLYFWEFKFDAVPTAFLALGGAAAVRRRFAASGVLFGIGAALKWSPAVAAALFAVWLVARRDVAAAAKHVLGFSAAFVAIVAPFLVWSPAGVWASVSRQAPRAITPESLWYLPLHAFGKASQPGAVYDAASVPHGADAAAVVIQVAVLLALATALAIRRPDLTSAAAVAVVGPAVFLLFNKVFSAQYLLTILAAGSLSAPLVGRTVVVAALLAVASAANALVYPIGRFWFTASFVLFACALAAFGVIVQGALRRPRSHPV